MSFVISASGTGSKLPAFGPDGFAKPSSQITASSSIPHLLAALAQSFFTASLAAFIVAKPLA